MQYIDDALAGRTTLPVVPRVAVKVLGLLRQDDTNLQQVAQTLEQDPVLSSRVLRMANSSYYGGRRSMASIADATAMIGLRALQTLVAASATQAAFVDVPGVNLRQFWMATGVTAAAARCVATHVKVDTEAAFSAGLLQAVGHLILCQAHPVEADRGFRSMKMRWAGALAQREQEVFQTQHPRVSAAWADRLGMPEAVVDAIALSLDDEGPNTSPLARIVHMACELAASVGDGDDAPMAAQRLQAALLEKLHLQDYVHTEAFNSDFAELRALPALP